MKKALALMLILALALLPAVPAAKVQLSVPTEPTGGQTLPSAVPTEPTEPETVPTEPTQPPAEPTEPAEPAPPAPMPELTSTRAFVYDLSANAYLYTKGDPDARIYPASITKLYSAWVALQYLKPEDAVTVGNEIDLVGHDSSKAWLSKGDQILVQDLVKAMLLPSGNDAAYTMAVNAARKERNDPGLSAREALERFAVLMNIWALRNHMRDSHFMNPDGYHHDDHYTTCNGLVTIGRLALENPVIAEAAAMSSATVKLASGGQRRWENTNFLVNPDSSFYCPEAVGLKTGSTAQSGWCLLAAFRRGEKTYIIGTLDSYDHFVRLTEAAMLFQLFTQEETP